MPFGKGYSELLLFMQGLSTIWLCVCIWQGVSLAQFSQWHRVAVLSSRGKKNPATICIQPKHLHERKPDQPGKFLLLSSPCLLITLLFSSALHSLAADPSSTWISFICSAPSLAAQLALTCSAKLSIPAYTCHSDPQTHPFWHTSARPGRPLSHLPALSPDSLHTRKHERAVTHKLSCPHPMSLAWFARQKHCPVVWFGRGGIHSSHSPDADYLLCWSCQ